MRTSAANRRSWPSASPSARNDRACRPTCPEPLDREALALALTTFGSNILREISNPTVIAVFRLAIAEEVRAPDVAKALNDIGIAASRTACASS